MLRNVNKTIEMQRPEYRNTFAISQSAIKAFRSKPLRKFKQIYIDGEENEEGDSKFAFGSLTDTLAFQPELLEERFFISSEDVAIPGDKVKQIVEKVYREAKEVVDNKRKLNEQGNLPEPLYIPDIRDLGEFEDLIHKYAKEIKYGGTTWTKSRIWENVFTDGRDYYRMLERCNGRSIITPYDNADAIEIVDILRKNEYTKPYFVQQEGETLLFQQEIFIEYIQNDVIVPLKGALDIIRINHNEKWVQVPDFKTTHNSEGFDIVAIRFDYVLQTSFYHHLIKEFLKVYEEGKCADYEIRLPTNIVIDRETKVPYIYEYNWEDIEIAAEGSKEKNVTGWKTTLKEIAWHLQTGIWDRPRELYETGKIKLKIY
jgi:hypothetical protein